MPLWSAYSLDSHAMVSVVTRNYPKSFFPKLYILNLNIGNNYYKCVYCMCTLHLLLHLGAIALDPSVFGGSDMTVTGLAFKCMGNETELLNCHYSSIVCAPFQQAAVLCQGTNNMTL